MIKKTKLYYNLLKINNISYLSIEKILCTLGYNKYNILKKQKKLKKKIFKFLINFIYCNKLTRLKQIQFLFITQKKINKTWQGINHIKKLPVRGQRTKTNAKTQKLYKQPRKKNKKKINNNQKWQLIKII